jgi:hypothetical protein
MITVNYPDGATPDPEWIDKAAELTRQLCEAPDKDARDAVIDKNSTFWGEIKSWLEGFSFGKCWFSEARDTFSHWQVEHFRPKKEAKEPDRDGYWWLAFNYRNYRLCGSVGNTKKGCYFPLRRGSFLATGPSDNCNDETPVLIDPTVSSDVMLLTFAEGGIAQPTAPDGWPRERARISIERYKLNDHPPLLRARGSVWRDCKVDVEHLRTLFAEDEVGPSPDRKARIKATTDRLKARIRPEEPFSAVASAFLAQCPERWAHQLLAGECIRRK